MPQLHKCEQFDIIHYMKFTKFEQTCHLYMADLGISKSEAIRQCGKLNIVVEEEKAEAYRKGAAYLGKAKREWYLMGIKDGKQRKS